MRKKTVEAPTGPAVRAHNRRLLLQLLRFHGHMSRAQLATASGLSSPAVTNVVAELLAERLVCERSAPRAVNGSNRVGRPGIMVSLDLESRVVLAVQIGAGVLQVGVSDLGGELLASEMKHFAIGSDPADVLDTAAAMLRAALASSGKDVEQVLTIGVGAAGLVDRAQRINLNSPNLAWTNVPMADFFETEFGLPTVVDHNVRAMAMAEAAYGLGQGVESLAFIYIRTGVGAGLVLSGREYRGGTHGSVEFGHIRVVPNGRPCNCGGTGCLETVATDSILRQEVISAGLIDASNEAEWVSQGLLAGIHHGDVAALRIRDALVDHLAAALIAVINLLNPEVIVVGGLLAELGDEILNPLRDVLPSQVLPIVRDAIRIERTSFDDRAGLVGAATVALASSVFGEPMLFQSHQSN